MLPDLEPSDASGRAETNFRSCVDTTVHLEKDLTILVGENNGGKTSVLDALRLLTTPSDGRRTRYPEVRDVHRDTPDASVRLEARFEGLSPTQKGWFLTALTAPTESAALLGYEWTPPAPGTRRMRPTLTVGPRRSPDPEPETRDSIRHVHLPALRDATRDLASSAPGRIESCYATYWGATKTRRRRCLDRRTCRVVDLLCEPAGLVVTACAWRRETEEHAQGRRGDSRRVGRRAGPGPVHWRGIPGNPTAVDPH